MPTHHIEKEAVKDIVKHPVFDKIKRYMKEGKSE